MLRGWIEIGMSNPNVFQSQSNSDIILRTYDTTSQANKIIIGNTASNDGPNRVAAMYVYSNNIGIRKLPSNGVALDVNGLLESTEARVSSNLTVGSSLSLYGDMRIGSSTAADMVLMNSNNNFSFVYSNVERLRIGATGAGAGTFINDDVQVRGLSMSNSMTLRPAHCNGDVFTDATSNDIIFYTSNSNQQIKFGFDSNSGIASTLSLSKTKLNMPNGVICASNMGVGTSTPPSGYDLYVAGATRIEGDLTVNGAMTYMNTDVQVTEQFMVSNAGTGPALVVVQTGAHPVAEFKDDDNVVLKICDGGFVTIGSNIAQSKLDVEGDATIRGVIYTSNVNTSNVSTSSLTALKASTCNLYTSNLIINNTVVIGSTGIIANSNLLPPLNTSNIVAGAFTSNFILDGNITSSKLDSNLVLKGTTTLVGEVTVSNGDMLVKGASNFDYVGDQARVFLGSNDYFIGASRGVGIMFQVPGTTYPVIIENTTGHVGIGNMDPEESLHVGANAKVMGSHYVMDKLCVGTSNPAANANANASVTVNGGIVASSNIKSSVGTLGPSFSLISEHAYADIPVGERLVLDNTLEAGNPGDHANKSLFHNGKLLYQDASGEDMAWNAARLLFRGCPMVALPSASVFTIQEGTSNHVYTNITSAFTLSNSGSQNGYVTYATPWFALAGASNSHSHVALALASNDQNASFRVGQVLVQMKS